jgi:hypothetical protein
LAEDAEEKTGVPPPAGTPPETDPGQLAQARALVAETRRGLLELKDMLTARRPGESEPLALPAAAPRKKTEPR